MEAENHSSDSSGSWRTDDSERSNSKRIKLGDGEVNQNLDFISRLPNTLLMDILSLLPVKYAASTTVLSRRWHEVWTYTPVLNISSFVGRRQGRSMSLTGTKQLVSTVSFALLLYQSPKIEKFNILIKYIPPFSNDIDAWLLFAVRKNVQELQLYLRDVSPYDDSDDDVEHDEGSPYALPPFLLKSSSLVTLKMSKCQFKGHGPIKWKSLKVLVLKYMLLTNDLIQDIFSGCPSLESLELSYCSHFDYIASKNLQHLVISSCNYMERSKLDLRISAPSLRSLKISGKMGAQRLYLTNSSASLVEANICFSLDSDGQTLEIWRQMFPKNLRGFLEKLHHVKYLTAGSWSLQVLSRVEDVISPFSNLMCLTLHTRISPYDCSGIARMLGLTPLLNTLIIDIGSFCSSWFEFVEEFDESKAVNGRDYWDSQKGFIQETLQNLRTVQLIDFKGSVNEMDFIAFMLDNTEHLEKLIIQRRNQQGFLATVLVYVYS